MWVTAIERLQEDDAGELCCLRQEDPEGFVPSRANQQVRSTGDPPCGDERFKDVLTYVESISKEQKLRATFTVEGDEVVVSP